MAGLYDSLFKGAVADTVTDVSLVPVDIGGYHMLNTVAARSYVQVFYKAAADVTLGTTVADFVIPLPVSGGATINFSGKGWRTRGPLSIAGTTDRTGLTAASVYVTLWKAR